MAENFIDVEITTEAQTLADDAIDRLQAQWPTWEPNDGDLEVVQIEAIAPMASNAAETAAQMPAAALRKMGTELFVLPYSAGAPAVAEVTFTLIDDAGHTIPGGTEIAIDDFAFTVDADVFVPPLSTTAENVPVTAAENGVEYNDLTGSNVERISALAFVDSFEVTTPSHGGVDPEDDPTYQNRLSRELELQAKTLVTTRDFELWARSRGAARSLAIGNTAREIDVYNTDAAGQPMSTAFKDALALEYDLYRQVNTDFDVLDPTYTTINVNYAVKAYATHDPADLKARIDTMLAETLLTPATWGVPRFQADDSLAVGWENEPIVYRNVLIDAIGNVEGVRRVEWVNITGSAGTVSGTNQRDTADFSGTVSGGTYRWTIDGQQTAAINHNADNATVLAALEALSTVEPGDVAIVAGGPGPLDYTIEHRGLYAARARTVSIASSVTGGGLVARIATVLAVAGTGDLTMPGVVPLPNPGVIAGIVS